MSGFNFNFNLENFGLGLLTGWGTAYALYRARHILGAARETVSAQASSAQEYATRTADSRYINDLVKYCQNRHLAGRAVPLTEIAVEPRFIPMRELAAPPEEDAVQSVFHVVPLVPDHPYLHATYNIETMSIEELGRGDRTIALLGLPGSGRTFALHTIAMWSLGRVQFNPPRDKVQEQLETEEAGLKADERAARLKARLELTEQFMRATGRRRENGDEAADNRIRTSAFRRLTPVYAHLGNISPNLREFGRNVDPAEPLVRAVQHYCGRVTAKTLPRNLYNRLNEGRVLLLLDGFDDLPHKHQPRILAWLEALKDAYSDNFIIVTGPARGYGGLVDAGFLPVFLRPWNDVGCHQLVDKWAESWTKIARHRGANTPGSALVNQVKADTRALSALELTVKTWGTFANPEHTDFESWIRTLLTYYLPNEPMGTILPKMILAATLQLNEGYITASGLAQLAAGQPVVAEDFPASDEGEPGEEFAAATQGDEDVDSLFESGDDENLFENVEARPNAEGAAVSNADLKERVEEKKTARREAKPKETKAEKEYTRLVIKLHKAGLLMRFRGSRYQFVHPTIAAYLGSLALRTMSTGDMLIKATDPAWQQAFAFAAMHTHLNEIVTARLEEPADVLQSTLLDTARWLAFAGSKPEWRSDLLKRLGNLFIAPNQFTHIRERIAAGLVDTRDQGVAKIFRKALQHPNPDVKRLACLGLGVLRAEDAIDDLVSLLDGQQKADVAQAAILALGAIGTQNALEEMTVTLASGAENLRYAAAESFAAIPDEGYPVLYDAIQHKDLMLRRAAVYGLRRVNAPWALLALYKTSVEDDQHYVRYAAEIALNNMYFGTLASGVTAHPDVEDIPWLRDWILEQMQTSSGQPPQDLPEDTSAYLLKVLDDGEPELQVLAVTTIGQLGLVAYAPVLYSALQHQNSAVREAALRALSELQMHIGKPLPSPI